jgi:putative membrane protein insertion efficiency factor
MKYICIWLIRFYQKFLSPLKRNPTCRFTPTCSAYAIEAFQKRGFFVGLGLTVWRILRCNPFSRGGYDPVPEKKARVRRDQRIGRDNEANEKEKE